MDQAFRFGYSTKNIPIPSQKEFKLQLIHSVRKFFDIICWRLEFIKNPVEKNEDKKTFDFKSIKAVPRHEELEPVQEALYDLIENIKFRKHNDPFQSKLKKDLEDIKNETKVIVKADKTSNYYKLETKEYQSILEKNIHKEYKKATDRDICAPREAHAKVVEELELEEKVFETQKRECFVTLKDHKPSFRNNPSCRLLNPCKPEIGHISKQFLETVVKNVKEETNLVQWKNAPEVIQWFKKIENKRKKSFIQFDMESFYPSITEPLLRDSINWASRITPISDFEKQVIFSSRNSLLYHNGEAWTKKGDTNFDVTMGSYDGAEVCDLVGLFILSKLQNLGISSLGLYRDDGLAVSDKTPRQNDILKKKICEVFRKLNLSITISANQNEVDFLVKFSEN